MIRNLRRCLLSLWTRGRRLTLKKLIVLCTLLACATYLVGILFDIKQSDSVWHENGGRMHPRSNYDHNIEDLRVKMKKDRELRKEFLAKASLSTLSTSIQAVTEEAPCEAPPPLIKPDPGLDETFEWQSVGGIDLMFLYSAYVELHPKIRNGIRITMIGIVRDYYFMPFKKKFGICVLWFSHRSEPSYVESDIEIVSESHNKKYSASYHTCEFDVSVLGVPYAVSFTFDSCVKPTNVLKILHRNESTLKYSTEHKPSVNSSHSKPISDLNQVPKMTHSDPPERKRVNFTVCVTPINNHFNDYGQITEMIEVNRMFGAQRFMFYDYSMGPEVKRVLDSYIKEGLVDVLPWKIPVKVNEISDAVEEIHYYGQLAALNDCLFRNTLTSKLIVFSDLDELIVPRARDTWEELIDDVSNHIMIDRVTKQTVYAPVYSIRNVFFRRDWESDAHIENYEIIKKLNLSVLSSTSRESIIYPHDQRSKYIVNPAEIRMAGIHFIYELSYDDDVVRRMGIRLEPNDALLHHYRKEKVIWDVPASILPQKDSHMLKYAKPLLNKISSRLKELGLYTDIIY